MGCHKFVTFTLGHSSYFHLRRRRPALHHTPGLCLTRYEMYCMMPTLTRRPLSPAGRPHSTQKQENSNMICLVDLEHKQVLQNPEKRNNHLAYMLDIKYKLEAISGAPCLLQRYTEISQERLDQLGIRALVISGNASDWADYSDADLKELNEIIRRASLPIIGFCGGHQLIATAHGAPIGPMRQLRPGESDVTDLSGPGYYKEWGFMPVQILQEDPIFAGIKRPPVFLEVHYWEVKTAPAGFQVLAATQECPIQVLKHEKGPVYGTQFHPEGFSEGPDDLRSGLVRLVYPTGYPEPCPDGRILLSNFFRLAGLGG